jgi:hypothetical protein
MSFLVLETIGLKVLKRGAFISDYFRYLEFLKKFLYKPTLYVSFKIQNLNSLNFLSPR